MAEFGGSDAMRLREMARKRQQEKEAIEQKMMEEKQKTENVAKLRSVSSRFAVKSDYAEEKLKTENVGLVTHEQFMQRQSEAAKAEAREEAEKEAKRQRMAGKRKRKKPTVQASKLSFGVTDGEDEEEEEETFQPLKKKKKTFGKNPTVDTSFLPDKEREQWEQAERERLKREWAEEQEKIKATEIPITYSYWDGTGHRRTLAVTKGSTVGELLEMVRREWKELRAVSLDNLLFIKEDLILPHDLTFYDLIISKARGKSGPLFHFDVHDDVRLMSDATKEKEESHAAKVVERHWYERNRHIFPASRWEVYDPKVQREKYTVKDKLKKN